MTKTSTLDSTLKNISQHIPWDINETLTLLMNPENVQTEGGVTFRLFLSSDLEIHEHLDQSGFELKVSLVTDGYLYSTALPLVGRGWRKITLPRRLFDKVETQSEGSFLNLELEERPLTHISARISDLSFYSHTQGPSLSQTELLEKINWDFPGLEVGKKYLTTGQTKNAIRELVSHIKTRGLHWKFQQAEPGVDPLVEADRLIRGDVCAIGLKHHFPEGNIDWLANPTLGTPQESPEWVWSLNRHKDWVHVAKAWQQTRVPVYVKAYLNYLTSWVTQAPVPSIPDEKPGSVWREIESGLRVTHTWFESFYAVLDCPEVSEEAILLFLAALWDHAHFLRTAPFNPTNHFIFGMTGLYTVGSEFPEFLDAKAWRERASSQLEKCLSKSTLPEGCWYELAPGYGQWVLENLLTMWENAEASGQAKEISSQLRNQLKRLAEWGIRLISPEGELPMLNDGSPLTYTTENLRKLSNRFPESQLLQFALSQAEGKAQVPKPTWTSEALPDSGYTVMRTGWGNQDSYLLLDVGPLGGWHGHQDALNLVAYFHGRYFLFDNGGYKYDTSEWRKYGPSTAAHNTVIVDHQGQLRSWKSAEDPIGKNPPETPTPSFKTTQEWDYSSGCYVCGYGPLVHDRGKRVNTYHPNPASHRREVLFFKNGPLTENGLFPFAVIFDTLTPLDDLEHHYEVRWHLKTTSWRQDPSQKITWTNDPGKPNLAVVALSGAEVFHADSGVKTPELLGWWFDNQNNDPKPALTLRQSTQVKGQTHFLTLLYPFQGDPTQNPIKEIKKTLKNKWTIIPNVGPSLTIETSLLTTTQSINVTKD